MGFFKAIGSLCGGFVSVAEETKHLDDCTTTRLWMKVSSLAKIPWEILLFDRGWSHKLEILIKESAVEAIAPPAGMGN